MRACSKFLFAPTLILTLAAGCAESMGVRPIDDQTWFRASRVTALDGDSISLAARQFLELRGLDLIYPRRAEEVLEAIKGELKTTPSREAASVLAELCYAEAKRKPEDSSEATLLYASAMVYAYAFLFDSKIGESPSPFDARYRVACDLYNRSLAKVVMSARARGTRWGDEAVRIPSLAGPIEISYGKNDMFWEPREFYKAHTVYEFEVYGLKNHIRTSGLGVPLIMLRKPPAPEDRTLHDHYLPRFVDQAYPATGLVTLQTSVCDELGAGETLKGRVDMYDPVETTDIVIDGQPVRLETDLTTPIAYMLENAPPLSGVTGLLDVPAWDDRRGLYMLSPYRPGKIPVVFVHGLLSSPMTWLDMMNDLNSDPEIRSRYQIWYFMYPTGNPIIYSASMLRESLLEAKERFDPDDTDAAFNNMVLVGHSMGGMLSRLMVEESDERLWGVVSDQPIKSLQLPPAEEQLLEDVFLFFPLPFVKRVVFLATPHRGSGMADMWITKMFASMITLPKQLTQAVAELRTKLASKPDDEETATSLSGLSAENPVLQVLSEMPINPDVTYHSIIADKDAAGQLGGTDTIVPYSSSSIDGSASELIILGTHSCTSVPAAIREVRRILLLHCSQRQPLAVAR